MMIIFLPELDISFFVVVVERESKNRINYLFISKNILLLFPVVGTDFCIQSVKSRNDNDIGGAPAKYLNPSI